MLSERFFLWRSCDLCRAARHLCCELTFQIPIKRWIEVKRWIEGLCRRIEALLLSLVRITRRAPSAKILAAWQCTKNTSRSVRDGYDAKMD